MNLTNVFSQMAVLFLVLALGYIGNKTKILNAESNRLLSRLILNIAVPCTILSSITDGSVTVTGQEALMFSLYALISLALGFIIAWPTPRLLRSPKADYGVIRLLLTFGNTGFMGYPVIQAVFGNGALFYVTLFGIPVNILLYSVGIMLASGSGQKLNFKKLVTPTFIISIAAVLIFAFKIPMPKIIVDTTALIGHITTPGAMLVIGSTLADIPFREVFGEKRIYPVVAVKLLVLPIVIWLIFRFFIADAETLGILIVQAAMPTATVATMLSLQYGSNDKLASKGVLLTTLFSILTIPLLLFVLF